MPGHILSFDILGDYRSTCLANCNKPPREFTLDRMLEETEKVYEEVFGIPRRAAM